MSSVTPKLDDQVLKLRRLLGDINNEDGTEIDASNVYSSTSGVTWKQPDLLDIYNDAIRQFMVYLVQNFPTEKWWEYLPSFVVLSSGVSVSTGAIALSGLTPSSFQLMDLRVTPTSEFVSTISDASGSQDTGGTLADGQYYYVVSPINANNEGTKSNEVHITVVAGSNNAMNVLHWSAMAGATGYRVYKGSTAGGENQYFTV